MIRIRIDTKATYCTVFLGLMHVKKERTLIHQVTIEYYTSRLNSSSVGVRRMCNHWIIQTKAFGLEFCCSMNSWHRNLCIVLSEARNNFKVVVPILVLIFSWHSWTVISVSRGSNGRDPRFNLMVSLSHSLHDFHQNTASCSHFPRLSHENCFLVPYAILGVPTFYACAFKEGCIDV